MAERQILTRTIPVSQARQKLGELINQVYRRQVRIIVEKSGIPVAALVSLADLEHCIDAAQEPAAPTREVETMGKEPFVSEAPAKEELARRQAVAARILRLRQQSDIRPLTTADLVRQVRKERRKDYDRWTR